LKKWFLDNFECHWLCQCHEIVVFLALAKPVAHFFNRLLGSTTFMERLESIAGRILKPKKSGRPPKLRMLPK
jgi:hypothetical protein